MLRLNNIPFVEAERFSQMATSEFWVALGSRVKTLREQRNMTQSDVVAELESWGIEISQAYLSRIERSERIPDADIVAGLARVFGVTSDYLLVLSDAAERATVGNSDEAIRSAEIVDSLLPITRRFALTLLRQVGEMDQALRLDREQTLSEVEQVCGQDARVRLEQLWSNTKEDSSDSAE